MFCVLMLFAYIVHVSTCKWEKVGLIWSKRSLINKARVVSLIISFNHFAEGSLLLVSRLSGRELLVPVLPARSESRYILRRFVRKKGIVTASFRVVCVTIIQSVVRRMAI